VFQEAKHSISFGLPKLSAPHLAVVSSPFTSRNRVTSVTIVKEAKMMERIVQKGSALNNLSFVEMSNRMENIYTK